MNECRVKSERDFLPYMIIIVMTCHFGNMKPFILVNYYAIWFVGIFNARNFFGNRKTKIIIDELNWEWNY